MDHKRKGLGTQRKENTLKGKVDQALGKGQEKKEYFQEPIEVMQNLFLLGDALLSTLDLEQLVKGFVSHLGNLMQATYVSLLLQEPNVSSPWAIAQWGKQRTSPFSDGEKVKKEVIFTEIDKKNDDDQILETTVVSKQREIDRTIMRLVVTKQKIVYAEDIAAIYKERGEEWVQLALEAGHHSAVAVPLSFLNQVTGAILLYSDQTKQLSSRDTFLLNIAAQQAALAIQNALSTQELKKVRAGQTYP